VEVQNAHFRAVFDKEIGGMLQGIAAADGSPLIGRAEVYTDSGVYEGRFHVGSQYEGNPRMTCRRQNEGVVCETEGVLCLKPGESQVIQPVRYRATYAFDASEKIRVSWAVMPEFDKAPDAGFLACTMQLPGFSQWFANTQDGLVCEQAGGELRRSFQSSNEPLSLANPRVGVVTTKGRVIVFEGFGGSVPIQNVFIHEGKDATATLFTAVLDGATNLKLEKGTWWRVDFAIRVLDSIEHTTAHH
jgi:hypothetical protein